MVTKISMGMVTTDSSLTNLISASGNVTTKQRNGYTTVQYGTKNQNGHSRRIQPCTHILYRIPT